MAEREEKASTGPLESDSPTYADRPEEIPANGILVELPEEPPPLTPAAARALLRLLLDVHRQRHGKETA